jgi:hypothetical protein
MVDDGGLPPPDQRVTMETLIAVDMKPTAPGVELTGAVTAQPRTGRVRSFVPPDADFAAVHLAAEGTRWVERDGPTFLYTSLGTQGGLAWFFPELPKGGGAGATATWRVDEGDPVAVQATEAARGRHKGVAPQAADRDALLPAPVARVTLERWTERGGVRVAELSMTAAREASMGPEELRAHVKETFRGAYAVLGSGRLLRAEVERDALVDLTTSLGGRTEVQRHRQHAERRMHLVSACDGPTESALRAPLTREERAVEAWGQAVIALLQDRREGVLAALDPEVRRRWGDDKLWDAFAEVRRLRGERAVPPPLLLADEDVAADPAAVRLITRASVPDPTQARTFVQSAVTVNLREVEGRFVATSLVGELSDDHAPLFEISRDRLVVRRDWPRK